MRNLTVDIFEDFLILNALYWKYIVNITFRQLTNYCFTLWFYNFVKKIVKRKKMMPF